MADPWRSARAYLGARVRLGMKFGLETMERLTEALGQPQLAYPHVLVAGTNGKGSVVAYVDAVLRASGHRVGRYTSPHLVRVTERITVNGREIAEAALGRAVLRVRAAAERLVREGRLAAHPTYFEVLTAAAFEHFRSARVGFAVLEVGLGGRLDATNVASPLASAIVSIDHDHREFLGERLVDIAREKAGVMRAGRPTVTGRLPPAAERAVREEARARGAEWVPAHAGSRLSPCPGGRVCVTTPRRRYAPLRALPGRHQQHNLLVALRLLETLEAAKVRVRQASLPAAIASTRWPGRLQLLRGTPPLLVDGAHNAAGARALRDHLRTLGPHVLVFGVMADKDVDEMARLLFPEAEAVVLTRPPLARAAEPAALLPRVGRWARVVEAEPGVGRALRRARTRAGAQGLVVVAGSLYLVGDVLRREEARTRASSRRK